MSKYQGSYDCIFKILLLGDSGVGKSSTLLRYLNQDFKPHHYSTVGVEFGSKTVDYHHLELRDIPTYENKKIKLQIWDTAGQERFRSVTRSYFRNAAGIIIVFDITNRETFSNLTYWLEELKSQNISNIIFEKDVTKIEDSIESDISLISSDAIDNDSDNSENNSENSSKNSSKNNFENSDENSDNNSDNEYKYFLEKHESRKEKKSKKNKGTIVKEFSHVRYPPIILVGNKLDLDNKNIREVSRQEAINFAVNNNLDYYIETSAMKGDGVEDVFNNLTKCIYSSIKKRGIGLNGVIDSENKNLRWYELETHRKKSCSC